MTATTSPMFVPTPSSWARPSATTAMIAPMISPTRSSFQTIQPTSRRETSLRAMARTIRVTVWLPTLPPVPISSGMKKLRATACSSSRENARRTLPVYASAMNSSSSQPIRFRTSRATLDRR